MSVASLHQFFLEDSEMVCQVSWVRADANKTVGKRIGYIFSDMIRVAAGWAEVCTFSTRLDVQVGLDEALD